MNDDDVITPSSPVQNFIKIGSVAPKLACRQQDRRTERQDGEACCTLETTWSCRAEPKINVIISRKLRQWPTWCTLALFFNTSTTILYMFRALMVIIRRLNCIDVASGIVLSVSGRPVHRTATDWEDDTRCCNNTIQPPDDEHVMLETCRGL